MRTGGAEVGRIVTVKVDGAQQPIELGHFVKNQSGKLYEVVRVHRVQTGKTAGRYELRGRVVAELPAGVVLHTLASDKATRYMTTADACA